MRSCQSTIRTRAIVAAPVTLASPLRIAFVGQRTFFEACVLGDEHPGVHTTFVEFRKDADAGRLRAALDDLDADVVIVFRPDVVPAGAFEGLRARTLGFLTEPIPRGAGSGHPDQKRRLWELGQIDPGNFDRIISFDPLIAETAETILPVWRSVPLPVADRFYAPVPPWRLGHPRVLFVGRSTEHREAMLFDAKAAYDVAHFAFGVGADELAALMPQHDVAINLHNETYPSFENRVSLHLAAGHLVLSEWLSPLHGLEPGIDFLEVSTPGVITRILEVLGRYPGTWHRVRIRGRMKAEGFRASRVYPRLIADLFADLAAFGST